MGRRTQFVLSALAMFVLGGVFLFVCYSMPNDTTGKRPGFGALGGFCVFGGLATFVMAFMEPKSR